MSFFALLILLSLILIVPAIFIIKERSKRIHIDSTQRHQQYLAAASERPLDSRPQSAPTMSVNSFTVIKFSSHHPFIKLLYDQQVPEAFRAIMDDIGQQYERTHHHQITESQLFTLNKLIEIRIPEFIGDYLSLDPNYATTVIIDTDKTATSYTLVIDQLSSILDFCQKLNTQSKSGVVDKLLASRLYLDKVCQDSGLTDDRLK
jgi:hypothetical protein